MYQPSKELTNVPNIVKIPRWKWLADAIREGSKRTTQCYRAYWVCKPVSEGGWVYQTCALGAAALALYPQAHHTIPMGQFIESLHARIKIACREQRNTTDVFQQIIRWNDDKHWTRERIADELEKL